MGLLNFRPATPPRAPDAEAAALAALLDGYSIEVMPRTAAAIADFRALLPARTRVYVAHIAGTPIADMVATARRLSAQGFEVMPHVPARLVADAATLRDWLARYRGEADVRAALVLAGGVARPVGAFHSSMQLLETGAFDAAGFTRLHVAGHPEGNRDIDTDGSDRAVMDALRWKAAFAARTDARMGIATQFAFEAGPVVAWAARLAEEGIALPVHVGVAGPAKLQTLIRFSVACGVGASLRVLQRRARDVTKLVVPFAPTEFLADLAAARAAATPTNIAGVHFFPLGGIAATASWTQAHGGAPPCAATPW